MDDKKQKAFVENLPVNRFHLKRLSSHLGFIRPQRLTEKKKSVHKNNVEYKSFFLCSRPGLVVTFESTYLSYR